MGEGIKSLLCIHSMHLGPRTHKNYRFKGHRHKANLPSETKRHHILITEITCFIRQNDGAQKSFTYLAAIRSLIFLQRFFRAFCLSLSSAILGSILSAGASTMCLMLYDARSSLDGSTPSCWCRTASWCFLPRKWLNRYTSEPIWK